MTAKELYEVDDTFKAAIAKWISDKRCPVELADYLREKDEPLLATAAEWAAWEIGRPLWLGERCSEVGGPYPGKFDLNSGKEEWFWCDGRVSKDADSVTKDVFVNICLLRRFDLRENYFSSAQVAILTLLDGYAAALAAGVEVPTATVGQLTEVR